MAFGDGWTFERCKNMYIPGTRVPCSGSMSNFGRVYHIPSQSELAPLSFWWGEQKRVDTHNWRIQVR